MENESVHRNLVFSKDQGTLRFQHLLFKHQVIDISYLLQLKRMVYSVSVTYVYMHSLISEDFNLCKGRDKVHKVPHLSPIIVNHIMKNNINGYVTAV